MFDLRGSVDPWALDDKGIGDPWGRYRCPRDWVKCYFPRFDRDRDYRDHLAQNGGKNTANDVSQQTGNVYPIDTLETLNSPRYSFELSRRMKLYEPRQLDKR